MRLGGRDRLSGGGDFLDRSLSESVGADRACGAQRQRSEGPGRGRFARLATHGRPTAHPVPPPSGSAPPPRNSAVPIPWVAQPHSSCGGGRRRLFHRRPGASACPRAGERLCLRVGRVGRGRSARPHRPRGYRQSQTTAGELSARTGAPSSQPVEPLEPGDARLGHELDGHPRVTRHPATGLRAASGGHRNMGILASDRAWVSARRCGGEPGGRAVAAMGALSTRAALLQ
jgi:hypothetical protein